MSVEQIPEDHEVKDDLMPALSASGEQRRRLWPLWAGAGVYFITLLNGVRYLGRLPLWVVILGTAVNAAMLTGFVVTIRRVYRRANGESQAPSTNPLQGVKSDTGGHKTLVLWLGAGAYFLAMLVALQYFSKLPPQFRAPAGIVNMAIVLTFVIKLRNAYLPSRS